MAEQRKRIKHKATFEEKLAEERPRDSNGPPESSQSGTRVAVALAAPAAPLEALVEFQRQQAIFGAPMGCSVFGLAGIGLGTILVIPHLELIVAPSREAKEI